MGSDPSLGQAVNRAARLLRRLADQRLAPFGITAGYLPVLTALTHEKALSQKALTELASIEQPTMAATLVRMQRDGLIEGRTDPADRRSVLFTLTPRTRQRLPEIENTIHVFSLDAVATLSPQKADQFRQLLMAVTKALEKALSA